LVAVRLHSSEITTLGGAWRAFARFPSPRTILAVTALVLGARLLIGDFDWRDAALAAGLVAIYPFGEWAIHVYLLHLKPFEFRGRKVEIVPAKEHRSHHEHPHALHTVLLGGKDVVGLVGIAVPLVAFVLAALVALLGGGFSLPAVLTATVAGGVLVFVYEWTHFLIHTSHKPRTALYRAVWRTHRLHHFKNEHYWHGITSTVADRAFGTSPDHREVPRSPTARSLQR
jgi:hypothetical protein